MNIINFYVLFKISNRTHFINNSSEREKTNPDTMTTYKKKITHSFNTCAHKKNTKLRFCT